MLRLLLSNLKQNSKPIKIINIQSRSFYISSPEPFYPIPNKAPKWTTAEEAVSIVNSGNKVFIHGGAATPTNLVVALANHGLKNNLKDIDVYHLFTEGPATYVENEYNKIFRSNSLFTGRNCRKAVNDGDADYTPIFLSEIPHLFRRNIINLDVALVQVSPPDEHGYCTLGPSVDCTRAAMQNAKHIIALVNPKMPRTFGDGILHMSHCDYMIEVDCELPEVTRKPLLPNDRENKIASIIANSLVSDGATIQTGMGLIPNAVLSKLHNHRDLGVHSEMFSDGIVGLVECGAITNSKKVTQTGKVVACFAIGSKRLYDFLDNNPFVVLCDAEFVNAAPIIASNPKVTAINSCIEIDLSGQVVSDSVGTRIHSGVGGQIDFMRGAALGFDGLGKPIIAMASTTNKGESKIVPSIKQGAGVVTTRAHLHYVVTEYGATNLFGKSLRQRAYELIKISHPDHRQYLEKEAFKILKCMPSR